MEAMTVERMLLSAWEEEGYIGTCRVPIGRRDIDVLAYNMRKRILRVGELKAQGGPSFVYVLDDDDLAAMQSAGGSFRTWLTPAWSDWLDTLPQIWNATGDAAVPWLPGLAETNAIEVVFASNSAVFADGSTVATLVTETVADALAQNPAVAARLAAGTIPVQAWMMSTSDQVALLAQLVRERLRGGYTRRFGDPHKDLFRELYRFLRPTLQRIPRNGTGAATAKTQTAAQQSVRQQTMERLLEALDISLDSSGEWV